MSMAATWFLAASMFAVAVVFSMLGQGGGTLYTPIQVFAGVDFHVAATTSLFLIMIMSLSATMVFRKAHYVDWPLAIVLETATTLGGLCGGLASGYFAGRTLSFVFACVVAVAAVFMVRDVQWRRKDTSLRSVFTWRRRLGAQLYSVNLPLALPVSFVAGTISGLIGVGGGILKVPMMVLLFGIPMEIAVGSSAFMVGLTAAGGFVGHAVAGHWDWKASVVLAVAVFAGGRVGAHISVRIDKEKLKKVFGWFLLGIACLMSIKAFL